MHLGSGFMASEVNLNLKSIEKREVVLQQGHCG
jgi:hypothetical protein